MKDKNVKYCYKVKHGFLKVNPKNAYKKPKIEQYGFMPIQETFTDEKGQEYNYWAEGWAKNISVKHNTAIGKWIRKNIEDIYRAEAKREKDNKLESEWKKSILNSGYEFDRNGNLIENEKTREDTPAQLCVMYTGSLHGMLFINVGGAIEFYDSETLLECASADILRLICEGVIYKKRADYED